ncbi:hypothetical protein [Streptococcus pluranimalium]|uniref:hypothetical protein n=1 Tax=Streptococcus pluranimalium TaxID=82348 RepID=UPI003F693C28
MKRTFFQKSYNLISSLLFFGIISFILTLAISLLVTLFNDFDIPPLNTNVVFIKDKLTFIGNYTERLASTLMLVAFSLIIVELLQRFFNDRVLNYFKSISQTMNLRQFLRQDEQYEPVTTIDHQTRITKVNTILKSFNQSVSKCTIDVRKDSITVLVKYPKTQQAQKLLRDMEEHIKEEIASRNPNYYFSSPHREGNNLWFKATRR